MVHQKIRSPGVVAIKGHKEEQGIHEIRMHGADEGRIFNKS